MNEEEISKLLAIIGVKEVCIIVNYSLLIEVGEFRTLRVKGRGI